MNRLCALLATLAAAGAAPAAAQTVPPLEGAGLMSCPASGGRADVTVAIVVTARQEATAVLLEAGVEDDGARAPIYLVQPFVGGSPDPGVPFLPLVARAFAGCTPTTGPVAFDAEGFMGDERQFGLQSDFGTRLAYGVPVADMFWAIVEDGIEGLVGMVAHGADGPVLGIE